MFRIFSLFLLFVWFFNQSVNAQQVKFMDNNEFWKLINSFKLDKKRVGESEGMPANFIGAFLIFNDGYFLYDKMETDPFTGEQKYLHTRMYCQISYKFFTPLTSVRVLVGGTRLGGQIANLKIKNEESRELNFQIQVNPAIMLENSGLHNGQIVIGSGDAIEQNFYPEEYPDKEAAIEASKSRCNYNNETLSMSVHNGIAPLQYLVEGFEKPWQAENTTWLVLYQ